MKKNFFLSICFMFVFIFLAFSEDMSLFGGSARLMSMANPEVVVADSTSNLDLYEAGFNSAIFTRPAKSVLFLYPGFDLYLCKTISSSSSHKTDEDTGFGFSNGTYKLRNNGMVIFPSRDLSIIIKPYASYRLINEKNIYPSTPSNDYEQEIKQINLNGGFGMAYKINEKIAFGIDLGYSAYILSMLDKRDNDLSQPGIRKLFYDISTTYYFDGPNGLALSLSGGNKTIPLPMPYIELNYGYYLIEFFMFNHLFQELYNLNTYSEYYSPGSTTKRWTDINTKGFNINLGVGKQGKGATAFIMKVGVVPGVGADYKEKEDVNGVVTESSLESFVKDGLGLNGEIGLRIDLGSVIPALKAKVLNTSYKQRYDSIYLDCSIMTYEINSGFSLVLSDSLMLPVELFYEGLKQSTKSGSNEQVYYLMDLGFKIGTEINLGNDLFLRLGSDYTYEGHQVLYYINGTFDHGAPGIGTSDNLAMTQIGINGGVGFKLAGSIETNIGLRYEMIGYNQKNEDYDTFNFNNLVLQTDLKILL